MEQSEKTDQPEEVVEDLSMEKVTEDMQIDEKEEKDENEDEEKIDGEENEVEPQEIEEKTEEQTEKVQDEETIEQENKESEMSVDETTANVEKEEEKTPEKRSGNENDKENEKENENETPESATTNAEKEQDSDNDDDNDEENEDGPKLEFHIGRTVTLQMLLAAKLLEPGKSAMTIEYLVRLFCTTFFYSIEFFSRENIHNKNIEFVFRVKNLWEIYCQTEKSNHKKQRQFSVHQVHGRCIANASLIRRKNLAVDGHQFGIRTRNWMPSKQLI